MSRSWITGAVIIVATLLALIVASPLGARFGSEWMPAIDFAVGSTLVLVAFLEGARAVGAWFNRRASLAWIAGGLVTSGAMFAAGTSFMIHARHMENDSIVTIGIIVALLGTQWQARAARRNASPA